MDNREREAQSMFAINLGLVANIILAGLKTTFGIIGHSSALLADGINSTSDVAYYIAVSIFMRLAHKPSDEEHPYGHQQLESISAMVVGAFVLTTAVAIFWDSINKMYDILVAQTPAVGASGFALVVALFTVGLKIILTFVTRRIGRNTNNPAILALAYDHRNDIFAASAASIGIFLGRMGHVWVDPLAGAIVSVVILQTGIEILRESSGDLMDTIPGRVLNTQVTALALSVPRVQQVEEVLAHRFGPYLVINITIGIDGSLSVREGDAIATEVEEVLKGRINMLQKVYVHYHPAKGK